MDSMRSPIPILVTGAGAPGIRGTLYALRNNPDQRRTHIIGVDGNPDVVGRYLVDRFFQVPFPEDPSYVDQLLGLCVRESIQIVIPQTTREVEILSQHREYFASSGVHVMVSDARAICIANNKWSVAQTFQRLGLATPQSRLARSEEEVLQSVHALGYPSLSVVVKPTRSNGMRGVRVLKENAWDVTRFLSEKPGGLEISLHELLGILRRGPAWPELVVMEYLPGAEYTVDLFRGERAEIAIPRLRKAIRSGITFESVLEFRQDLIDNSILAAREIGLKYAFGFQFKLSADGVARILESNPRVQGTMAASVFSGANIIWMAVRELLGEAPSFEQSVLKPAAFYRYWGGVGVCGEHVDEI